MSVTVASFRADFPQEFGNLSAYPNQAVAYWLAISKLILNQGYWGVSPTVASSPPTAIIDFVTELWIAHQLVLEKQAVAAAAAGGDPGTRIGVINNKSVGGVSIGFDTQSVVELDGGFYNQTTYGMRFLRLARLYGSGPVQIGIGRNPPFLFFNNVGIAGGENAWAGPYPGIEQGDSGFGG